MSLAFHRTEYNGHMGSRRMRWLVQPYGRACKSFTARARRQQTKQIIEAELEHVDLSGPCRPAPMKVSHRVISAHAGRSRGRFTLYLRVA